MECSEPGVIRDEEIIAYLSGERVRAAVTQHLPRCQRCSSLLASYGTLDHSLSRKLYRWDCPSNQVLGEYQIGLLDGKAAAFVQSHLSICVLCASEVTALAQFLADDPMLVEPVSHAAPVLRSLRPVQGAKRTLDQFREKSLAGARRIVATLLEPQPRLAFAREISAQSTIWPRSYSAEGIHISLQLEPDRSGTLQLIGLISREGTTLAALQGTPVQLLSHEQTVSTQSIDELGNFVFSALAPDTYTVEVQLPEGIVAIEELPLTTE